MIEHIFKYKFVSRKSSPVFINGIKTLWPTLVVEGHLKGTRHKGVGHKDYWTRGWNQTSS